MEWSPREKHRVLHMIGNAHIDPVWLWQWQDGFHEVKATFRSALDRMNEYDDFVFVSSSAAFYEWVEQSDPQMFAEIQQRVAEGRWEMVGGWWIEPDCNIPCGESFVRQGLYGQRYFKEKFGVIARVGYNVDSFGHNGMLPQILKKSGMDYYVFMRPSPHEKGLPGRLFWWESDDGSRVLAFRMPCEYCTWGKDLEQHIRRCAAELKAPYQRADVLLRRGQPRRRADQGKPGEHPRAWTEPLTCPSWCSARRKRSLTRPWIRSAACPSRSSTRICSTTPAAATPLIRGSNAGTARRRTACWPPRSSRSLASLVTGQPYPTEFDRAWKNVLFNQFHDILAGTSLEEAYEDARDPYGEALSIADRAANLAAQSLAWNIDIPVEEAARPVVVFNPHAWTAKASVELEIGDLQEADVLLDDRDRQVPSRRSNPRQRRAGGTGSASWPTSRRWATGRTGSCQRSARQTGRQRHGFPASDTVLENDRFRLEIDPETGYISSLRDKKAQVEVLAGPAARPVVMDDPSDTWSHNVFNFDHEIGVFRARTVRLVEQGPVRAVIRVESEYGNSHLFQDFTLYRTWTRSTCG